MLDGLLGRGFSSKCKSIIKATRTRIELVRRRAEAKQRFLKEDLAKLLSNGLDINAYGRTEEFIAGLSLLSCYDFIEESCEYVVKQLSKMQKLGECPEEFREAVASLMFAAARFSDLPELRDLRDTFQERYGNSLECFVNQKFIEKLSTRSPTTEKRLQVLQDIASEFSIKWNCKGFEQRMTASALAQVTISERHIPKQSPLFLDDGNQTCNRREINVGKRNELNHVGGREKTSYYKQKSLVKGEDGTSSGGQGVLFHGRQGLLEDKRLDLNGKDDILLKGVSKSSPSPQNMVDNIVGGHIRHNDGVNTRKAGTIEALSCKKPDVSTSCTGFLGKTEDLIASPDHVNGKNLLNSTGKARLEETDRLKSCYNNLPPPPYIKSKDNSIVPLPPYTKPKEDKHEAIRRSKHGGSNFDGHFFGSSPHNRIKSINSLGKSDEEPNHLDREGKSLGLVQIESYGNEKKADYYKDNAIPLQKQRSNRRKHQKSSSNHDSLGNVDNFSSAKRSSSSRRRDHSRKGLQILFDNEHDKNDEEEQVIDRLLIHYSKKPSSYDASKSKKKLLSHSSMRRSIQRAIDAGELSLDQSRDGQDIESEIVPLPARSISLPHKESGSLQVKKVFARANTFQPDNQARHVHPKLPDYDDLAARIAALRGQ
ncbi:uncharacterized protein LOC111399380 isoform X2 [Olea europaea var. sylvestris]|uniref:uncharacterized protein LOC111399380 isoform X2 n=1 Tax=Olea europaea var. sylvestris TaxID=158386 RepID=UPI000C1D144E|nr:uncharacterized protein LOC111399380 isoform X2 [Olea europaea var. sylvestris]